MLPTTGERRAESETSSSNAATSSNEVASVLTAAVQWIAEAVLLSGFSTPTPASRRLDDRRRHGEWAAGAGLRHRSSRLTPLNSRLSPRIVSCAYRTLVKMGLVRRRRRRKVRRCPGHPSASLPSNWGGEWRVSR